jgi:hypothetical protein
MMRWRPNLLGIRALTAVVAVGAMLIAGGTALLIAGEPLGAYGTLSGVALLAWVELGWR